MRIHLDPVGGIAGDMFIAAIIDARRDLFEGMLSAIRDAGLPGDVALSLDPYSDSVLTGNRFIVDESANDKSHHHTSYISIKDSLSSSRLDGQVKKIALGIFELLADAEARVHGKTIQTISFHEVGEWDSIADIVGAAFLIKELEAEWSVGTLPMGQGLIQTAHGDLPVPTPATVILLEGYTFYDDGLIGERITPTGAAIIAYLKPRQSGGFPAGRLLGSGHGFGTKLLKGKSNVLRVLILGGDGDCRSESVYQIKFDVDDQSPEDLAIALDHIRGNPTVLDVLQLTATGKKGRTSILVRIIARVEHINRVFEACFYETATLGLRYQLVNRVVLNRWEEKTPLGGAAYDYKIVTRGGVHSGKVEADTLKNTSGYVNRANIRAKLLLGLERNND